MIKLLASTNQEAFDKVVAHLKVLPRRSMNDDQSCVYSHKTGGCAIGGPLMTAEDAEACDKQDTVVIAGLKRDKFVDIGALDIEMLTALQVTHDYGHYWNVDGSNFSGNFRGFERLREIGEEFGLDVSQV